MTAVPAEPPLIEIDDLVVRFRTRRGLDAVLSGKPATVTAVDHVSLRIGRGDIYGLVGESGSGKTTLGKTILRLVDPTSGAIRVEGRDVVRLSERRFRPVRRKLQTIFQDPLSSLNPRHRVGEALATPLALHRMVPPGQVERRVDEILNRVGLPAAFKQRYPHELSGGQLQRVAIGRALTMDPAFLIADEAVSKLDVSVRAQILNLFKDIQASSGMTMLFITHDLHVARYLCSRIGVMYFGKLVEEGPTEELFRNPRHPYTKALLSTIQEGEAATGGQGPLLAEEAFNPSQDDLVGCRFYKRCRLRQPHCAVRHPPLEVPTDAAVAGHRTACYEWQRVADATAPGGRPATQPE